jgi:hypothetical protein
LNSRRAELLDNARLVSQVAGLERHASRSGSESIDHAPGGHDDLANAAAGALVRCASGGVSSRLAGGGIVSQRGGGQVQIFTGTEPKTRPGPGDPVYWQKRRGGL